MAEIVLDGVTKVFGEVIAVNTVSLTSATNAATTAAATVRPVPSGAKAPTTATLPAASAPVSALVPT